jgi:arginyl-tRNA---protein transferase
MYHRIDGRLVAVSVIDILETVFVSAYCIYDPDMSFLTLGVVTAMRELEYMRMIRQKYNPKLKWYQLGELVVTCPKVNYKLKYKPGYMICPRTKELVPLDKCIDKINIIA